MKFLYLAGCQLFQEADFECNMDFEFSRGDLDCGFIHFEPNRFC